MFRGMAHEDNSEKSSYVNPNGGNCDVDSGSLVNKGKSISTRPSPRKGRRRGSGALQLEKKESPQPSPYHCRYSDTVLPVNPNLDLSQSTDLPLNPVFSDFPEKNQVFVEKMEELAKSMGFVDPPSRAQGKASGPRSWSESLSRVSSNYNRDLLHQQRLPMNSTWPLHGLYHQETFPMVSLSSTGCSSSPSSSSVMRFMEPPSNQINSNSVSSIWQPQDQSVGKKRPYPYSVDSVILDFKEEARMHRDGPSSSTSAPESNANIKNMRCNDTVTRDFLSLAPRTPSTPSATSSRISRFRHPNPAASILPYHVETVDFSSLPYQMEADGEARNHIFGQGAYRWNQQSVHRCRYRDFFPPAAEQNGQATTSNGSNGGEGEESLDLELRLRLGKSSK